MIDASVLPDEPGVWSTASLPYRQRWVAGAFGDRDTLAGVGWFKVRREEWALGADGVPERTILEAECSDRMPPA